MGWVIKVNAFRPFFLKLPSIQFRRYWPDVDGNTLSWYPKKISLVLLYGIKTVIEREASAADLKALFTAFELSTSPWQWYREQIKMLFEFMSFFYSTAGDDEKAN